MRGGRRERESSGIERLEREERSRTRRQASTGKVERSGI